MASGRILIATSQSNRVSRAIDRAHSTRTERNEDFVGTELRTRVKGPQFIRYRTDYPTKLGELKEGRPLAG